MKIQKRKATKIKKRIDIRKSSEKVTKAKLIPAASFIEKVSIELKPKLPPTEKPRDKLNTDIEVTAGKVLCYCLKLDEQPVEGERKFYFYVFIADLNKGKEDNKWKRIVEFRLTRIASKGVDKIASSGEDRLEYFRSVMYSDVQMAMIATLKDALIHNKQISIRGKVDLIPIPSISVGESGSGRGFRRLKTKDSNEFYDNLTWDDLYNRLTNVCILSESTE